jgi:prepilin-type N-terminal cleavage/methylation domain-containing protein
MGAGPGGHCARRLPSRRSLSTYPRRAFTLVELLTVTGIVALMSGVTLPAVQQARAAAGRLNCQSNARQVALAVHGFHDANGCVPDGKLGPWDRPGPFQQLAPFLEAAAGDRAKGIGRVARAGKKERGEYGIWSRAARCGRVQGMAT